MTDYVKPDRTRRVLVLPTVSKRTSVDSDDLPVDSASVNELLCVSMITRVKYNAPPLSARCVLHTLFHGRTDEALSMVVIKPDATVPQCIASTMLLCWHFGVSTSDMTLCLQRIGTLCYITAYGMNFIHGITPRCNTSFATPVVDPSSSYSKSTSGPKATSRWN